MAIRKIIKIEEEKCNGCGLCVPNCVEGAIQIINGKAKLVKDSYCDGLGACLGHCPQDALHIVERDADEFDEQEAAKFVQAQKQEKPQTGNIPVEGHHHGGCPGTRIRMMGNRTENTGAAVTANGDVEIRIKPQLRQWPVQLSLVPVSAPFFQDVDLLVTADCVPFAYPDYHLELLKGKALVVGCPKLDDIGMYTDKLTRIFSSNDIKSVTVAHMEVPCCSGIVRAVETAVSHCGKDIPVKLVRITIDGRAERQQN